MIRQPSDRAELYTWHAKALQGLKDGRAETLKELAARYAELVPPIQEDNPQCGWFKAIVRRVAVPVPARIWLRSTVDEDGELVEPEVLLCDIGDEPWDVLDAWPKLCTRPISKAEWAYLMAVRAWARTSAPDQPQAKDGRPIDWLTVKIPAVPGART